MVDYQGFARTVVGGMQPRDDTQSRLLLGYKLKADAEDRDVRREESRLARAFQERQMQFAEKREERAARTEERQASIADIELGVKLNNIALQRATAANSPEAWDAAVEQTAQEFEAARPGLGQGVLQYRGRFGEREKLIEGMVGIDTRYKAMLDRMPLSPEVEAQKARLAQAGRPQTTLNVGDGMKFGTIPPGHVLKQLPDGGYAMEPVPGSPAAREVAEANQKAAGRQAQTQRAGDVVVEDISRVFKLMSDKDAWLPTAGSGIAGAAARVPGTNAYDAAALLATIKANIGFDKLQAMRQASPTGGALGSITEGERAALEATMGNLDQSQSKEQFERNLRRLNNQYLDIVHGPGEGPPRMVEPDAARPPAADLQKLSDEELLKQLGITN